MATNEATNIRPMALADIIDSAINMYRHNFLPFFLITAIAYVPAVLAQFATVMMLSRMGSLSEGGADMWLVGGTFVVVFTASWLVYAVAVPLAQGALIWAVSRRYLGRSISVGQAYAEVIQRFWQILLVILVTGAATMVGAMMCLIPGLILGVMLSFAVPEVVLNDRPAFEAIGESWDLARYDFWKVLSTLIVLSLLVAIVAQALAAPLTLGVFALSSVVDEFLIQAVGQTLKVIVQAVLQPVAIIGTILLYYDLRIRRDGFDLQLLAASIETDGESPGTRQDMNEPLILPENSQKLPPKIEQDTHEPSS